jgi:hypothetical protein
MTNDTEGEWLIPFQGRKWSGSLNLNLLWRSGSTYIMDNHRAALWCWFQHLSQMRKYNLIHIDRHTDTVYSQMEILKEALPENFTSTPLNTYLSYEYEGACMRAPVIRWDNYLSLFFECYPDILDECIFATHDEGDKPRWKKDIANVPPWDLPGNFDYWLEKGSWIVNVDLDYFYYGNSEFYSDGTLMFSKNYIEMLFSKVRQKQKDGTIVVLTISLSPECCAGWDETEVLCNRICKVLDLSFQLP